MRVRRRPTPSEGGRTEEVDYARQVGSEPTGGEREHHGGQKPVIWAKGKLLDWDDGHESAGLRLRHSSVIQTENAHQSLKQGMPVTIQHCSDPRKAKYTHPPGWQLG